MVLQAFLLKCRCGVPDSYREVVTLLNFYPQRVGIHENAGVVELVDTLVSGTSAARLESSSLSTCTKALRNGELFYSEIEAEISITGIKVAGSGSWGFASFPHYTI